MWNTHGLMIMIVIGILSICIGLPLYGIMTGQDSYTVCEKKGGELIMTDYGGVCVQKGTIL